MAHSKILNRLAAWLRSLAARSFVARQMQLVRQWHSQHQQFARVAAAFGLPAPRRSWRFRRLVWWLSFLSVLWLLVRVLLFPVLVLPLLLFRPPPPPRRRGRRFRR